METENNHNKYRFNRLTHDTERSAMVKYKALIVGHSSWGELIAFEFITGLAGGLPGAPGLYLRQKLFPRLFKKVGRSTHFGRHITLR